MRQIQLTRKAIKDLQRLQSTGANKIPEKLFKKLTNTQEGENFSHTEHLKGHPHLWRSRKDLGGGSSLRLIWTNNLDDDSIRFLYADQRNDDTYDFDLNELPQEPAYTWNGETGVEWALFLNGAYKASPVLTTDQRETSRQVGNESSYGEDPRIGFFAHITQSPPGTGKTITAALRACELYESGWNVIFLLPQRLLEDVKTFHCIQSMPSELSEGFFCGTFQDWIIQFCPEVSKLVLSPEEELEILRELATRAKQPKRNLSFEEVDLRDLILFQSFVLKSSSQDFNFEKNTIYKENEQRIKTLKNIKSDRWRQEFSKIDKRSRSEIADKLCERWKQDSVELINQDRAGTVLIIDESQDYLLNELRAFKNLCQSWHQAGRPTHLWLLGDLNQRIMPVDFDWGALQLVPVTKPDWKCFRNTSHILRFSNLFLSPVKENSHKHKTKSPPKPADPNKAYEVGESVKLLVYKSQSEAESFLDRLSQSLGAKTQEIEKSRSLTYKLASRVTILQPEQYKSKYSDRLEFFNVYEAKGREFDTCVIFNIFRFKGETPTSEDWWQWYTLLTRTRSRLLVVVTSEQFGLLEDYIPNIRSECELVDSPCSEAIESEVKWIQAVSNDLELSSKEKDIVKRYLSEALKSERPLIYWDTYEVLDRLNITEEERTELETSMLKLLSNYPNDILGEEFDLSKSESTNCLLHCLILRAMRQSRDAVKAIEDLKETNEIEYTRVIEAVAKDLEAANLIVEAARVRFQKLNIPYPTNLPLPEIAQVDGDFLNALISVFKPRLQIK